MKTQSHYWFKAKRYGYGWSYPLVWQGWLTYIVCFTGFVVHFGYCLGSAPTVVTIRDVLRIAVSFAWIGLLLLICYRKGEPARWRWGDDEKK